LAVKVQPAFGAEKPKAQVMPNQNNYAPGQGLKNLKKLQGLFIYKFL
jgi:hypothetical protein